VDTGFVDLDILLTRIRHAPSKVYLCRGVEQGPPNGVIGA
jgi:hypothetical protein